MEPIIYIVLASVAALVVIFAISVATTDRDADAILAVLTWEPQTSREISVAAFGEYYPTAKTYVALNILESEGWAERCSETGWLWRRKRMGKRKWGRGRQVLGGLRTAGSSG